MPDLLSQKILNSRIFHDKVEKFEKLDRYTNYENFCLILKKNNNTGINNDILETFC